jgi:aerobic carbon-monoxide dehydrogenase medium subunit
MKPAAFEYVRPKSLEEAVRILSGATGDAQVMAGGQSLVAMMNLRVAAPDLLIDIARLEELRAVSETSDHVVLGACVTHAAIEDGLVPDPSRSLMPEVASNLAYRAVRTRGTLGGSLALSDPAADWPTVMAALAAQVILRGPRGERPVDAVDFATGVYETVRAADEIIASIRIPKLCSRARWGYAKFCRKSGEFANSIAAAVRDPDRDYARVVLGAVNGPPIILQRTSSLLLAGDGGDCQRTIAEDLQGLDFDDFQASLHGAMASRAVRQVLA